MTTSPTNFDSTIRVSQTSTAVAAEIEGQMVALDVNKGVCYGLNRVATRIWQIIEQPANIDEICVKLMQEFDVDKETCEKQTIDLVRDLVLADLATTTRP